MIVEQRQHEILVQRETADRHIPTEANFWYLVGLCLNRERRRMAHFGNPSIPGSSDLWQRVRPHKWALTGMPYALRLGRSRKRNKFIIDNDYAIRCPAKTFNGVPGEVRLSTVELSNG